MRSFNRRTYAREYVRRRYDKKLVRRNLAANICQRRFGRSGICGGALHVNGPLGRDVPVCYRCERFKLGVCADCPARVAGAVRKARRCAACTKRSAREAQARYRVAHRREVNRRAKLAARKNSKRRADYKRLWRAAHREKVAAQKRRYMLRQPQGCYAYHRKYRETHEPKPSTVRYCLGGCGVIVRHRVKKCADCKAALKASALRMLGKVA